MDSTPRIVIDCVSSHLLDVAIARRGKNMWIFGYGSLVWKADFPYEKKLVGCIKGYVRRFYQKSPDHRGIPDRPGRVTTLLSSNNENDEVWGLAYKIAPKDINNVVNHLDFRERGGYKRKTVLFYPKNPLEYPNGDNSNPLLSLSPIVSKELPFHLTIYIGDEDNPNYAGTEDLETIARTIVEAEGLSGKNKEYLYKLAVWMRIIAPDINDDHLFTLEEAVKNLDEEEIAKRKCN